MPRGIAVIEFDQFEGAVVSLKYPEDLELPVNYIQQIQVSHTFTPGIIFLREENLNAVTFGNEENQKIIVLVLNEYEDGEDFRQIIMMCNEVFTKDQADPQEINAEIERLFILSQHVFRAREAVLDKMAREIQELKNREIDVRNALRYLMTNETDLKYRVLHCLILNGALPISKLVQETKISEKELLPVIAELQHENKVDNRNGIIHLLIIYY